MSIFRNSSFIYFSTTFDCHQLPPIPRINIVTQPMTEFFASSVGEFCYSRTQSCSIVGLRLKLLEQTSCCLSGAMFSKSRQLMSLSFRMVLDDVLGFGAALSSNLGF